MDISSQDAQPWSVVAGYDSSPEGFDHSIFGDAASSETSVPDRLKSPPSSWVGISEPFEVESSPVARPQEEQTGGLAEKEPNGGPAEEEPNGGLAEDGGPAEEKPKGGPAQTGEELQVVPSTGPQEQTKPVGTIVAGTSRPASKFRVSNPQSRENMALANYAEAKGLMISEVTVQMVKNSVEDGFGLTVWAAHKEDWSSKSPNGQAH